MQEPEESPRRERGARARRAERLAAEEEDQASGPVRPDWRNDYKTPPGNRRSPPGFSSPQEAILWLQGGGWRWIVLGAGAIVLLLILALIFRGAGSTAEETPTSRATSAGLLGGATAIAPLSTITPLPNLTPTPPAASAGSAFVVAGTGDLGLFLRADHSSDAQVIETLPDGTRVEKVGEDFTGADRVWRNVKVPSGQQGWVAVEYLQPAP